jgi:hypothetical protein
MLCDFYKGCVAQARRGGTKCEPHEQLMARAKSAVTGTTRRPTPQRETSPITSKDDEMARSAGLSARQAEVDAAVRASRPNTEGDMDKREERLEWMKTRPDVTSEDLARKFDLEATAARQWLIKATNRGDVRRITDGVYSAHPASKAPAADEPDAFTVTRQGRAPTMPAGAPATAPEVFVELPAPAPCPHGQLLECDTCDEEWSASQAAPDELVRVFAPAPVEPPSAAPELAPVVQFVIPPAVVAVPAVFAPITAAAPLAIQAEDLQKLDTTAFVDLRDRVRDMLAAEQARRLARIQAERQLLEGVAHG